MESEKQIVSETIKYVRRFHGSRIVVRLDDKVAADVLERSVYGEIDKIRQAGIKVIVVHSSLKLDRHGIDSMIYFKETGYAGDNAAMDFALKQKARKLIFVTNARGVFCPPDKLLRNLSVGDASKLLTNTRAVTGPMRDKLKISIMACNRGIERVHIIGSKEGYLLREIFTCDGVGTMIYAKTYEQIRPAETYEISDIMEILRTTISQPCFNSTLVAKALNDFWVFSVDGDIQGCMQLTEHHDCKILEVACLAVTSSYENQDVVERLLRHALDYAAMKKLQGVFLNIKENTLSLPIYPWFTKLGFKRDVFKQVPLSDKNVGADCWVSVL